MSDYKHLSKENNNEQNIKGGGYKAAPIYRYLDELRQQNVERISSKELSKLMNVTASQIRQDLNNLVVSGSRDTDIMYSIYMMKSENF